VKERGILFSAPLVRALLAGTKTQTRRLMKQQPSGPVRPWQGPQGGWKWVIENTGHGVSEFFASPYGVPGDRLWVRETWGYRGSLSEVTRRWTATVDYMADGQRREIELTRAQYDALLAKGIREQKACPKITGDEGSDEWWASRNAYSDWLTAYWKKSRPSIFLPRWASRITLEVTALRAERLQSISEEDARAEGVTTEPQQGLLNGKPATLYPITHRQAFTWLWDAINGKRASWASNPFVWVVSFRRLP
jgi:hypothetical protein